VVTSRPPLHPLDPERAHNPAWLPPGPGSARPRGANHGRRLVERVEAGEVVVAVGQELEQVEPFQGLGDLRADADQVNLLDCVLQDEQRAPVSEVRANAGEACAHNRFLPPRIVSG